jgi:hypothetical protein
MQSINWRKQALVFLVACGSKTTTPPLEAPPPSSADASAVVAPSTVDAAPSLPPPDPDPAPPQLGGDCANGQTCAAPATCVSYRGIAGARGPEFKTCEIKCADAKNCPNGTKCMTIADGPGRVCR